MLGLAGSLLGARRLAMVTVVLEVAALLSGLAATDSLILGIGPYDQERPPAG